MARIDRVTLNFGVLKFDVDDTNIEFPRLRRSVLFGGPCLIICRQWGRALDAGPNAGDRTRPVVWDTHALPWQQWVLERQAGKEWLRIVSLSSGFEVAATGTDDWSPVELRETGDDRLGLWKLLPSEDGTAYVIENAASGRALDATETPDRQTHPHLWSTHWANWQQWIVVRMPLREIT